MDGMRFRALAHDMRTPAGTIAALSQLIAAHAGEPDAVRAYAKRLDAACAQLTALAEAALEPDAGYAPALCTPEALAREAASLFGERIELAFSGTCDQVIAADRRAVCRILCNLLSNAVKYTPPGGRIVLEGYAGADAIRFTVRDTGAGMGEKTLARLFQPYARGEEAMRAGIPGAGLGLCASWILAQEMGGEITVQSREGEGSVFTLTLPRAIPQAVLAGRRFLVAEDNPLACSALCELLEESGAQAVCAADGHEALRLFSQSEGGAFDAAIMDVQMPGMDGLEAARAIRNTKRQDAEQTTIIMLTGDLSSETRKQARECGADFCVLKPLGMQVLAELLARTGKKPDTKGVT